MVNPDVDCYIETPNQQKYSKKRKNKLLKTKRILTLRYKPNGALSFAFTVACRRKNSSLQKEPVDPNTLRFATDNLSGVEKKLEIPSFAKNFSGVPSKIFFHCCILLEFK